LQKALIGFGGSVTFSRELIHLQQSDEQVVVGTSDGHEAAYDIVIGADGINSKVRESLGIEYLGFDLPETWSIADVDAQNWPNAGIFTICLLSGGRVVVVVPLEAGRFRVVSNTENALATLPLKMNVITKHREGQFNLSIRQASHYDMGRVFLAGDAAHCHSPIGGRGMNMGISDAADLASRIATNQLNGYSISRHQVGANIIATTERARRVLTSRSSLTRIMTTTVCRSINLFPFLQRSFARIMLDG
jgi:2-polyprenyl-6-methoxyphenol hydroxylase-like FAD-dependent oxidoreductase